MKVLILPGFSLHNKEWAYEVAKQLGPDAVVHEWKHWETQRNRDFNRENEAATVIEQIGTNEFSIVAKSIGTYVTSLILPQTFDQIGKIILCGIPLGDLDDGDKNKMTINLRIVSPSKMVSFQNINDPHGKADDVKKLLEEINPSITLVEKDRNDHEYPYFEEFKKFLGDN